MQSTVLLLLFSTFSSVMCKSTLTEIKKIDQFGNCNISQSSIQGSLLHLVAEAQNKLISLNTTIHPACVNVPDGILLTNDKHVSLSVDCRSFLSILKHAINSVISDATHLSDSIILRPNAYSNLSLQLHEKVDFIGKQFEAINEEVQSPQLHIYCKCFMDKVLTRLNEIDSLRMKYELERMKRVVALIQPENYGEAEYLFYELNNMSLVEPILGELYQNDKIYFEQVVAFVLILHSPSLRLTAYRHWVWLMEEEGRLLSPGILVLSRMLNDEVAKTPNPSQELLELNQRAEIYSSAAITGMALEIRRRNFSSVLDFGSPLEVHMIGEIFNEYLPRLIDATYKDDPLNFGVTLEFIDALRWNVHRYSGLSRMFEIISDNRRLVVAYKIKLTMASLSGPDPAGPVMQKLIELKLSLPQNVQSLLWHVKCNLKNKQYSEYLYTDMDMIDGSNRHIFTYVPRTTPAGSSFQLLPVVRGDFLKFNIESRAGYNERFLDGHPGGGGETSTLKYVSLQPSVQSQYPWSIELLQGTEVKVKNDRLGGYLLAWITAFTPNLKRKTFVWVHADIEPTTHIWNLECVEN